MAKRDDIVSYLDQWLEIEGVPDYGPNGLQVEGSEDVERIALGVTSSLSFLEAARAWGANMAIVHHGLFWAKAEDIRIVRSLRKRLGLLIESNMTLLGYHLPLDRHLVDGNAAIMARELGLSGVEAAFDYKGITVGVTGAFDPPIPVTEAIGRIARTTGRDPLVFAEGPESVRRVGIATGGAQGLTENAAEIGCEMYITGESTEYSVHVAREEGMHVVSAGHHATERFGVQALAERISDRFDVEARYIEISNYT